MVSDTTPAAGTDSVPAQPDRAERAHRIALAFEQARAGDSDAFDYLVRQLNPLLWNVARSQGLPADEAADVVQTTWLELLRRMNEIQSPRALPAWLITTARRGAWRSRTRRQPDDGTDVVEATVDPAASVPELAEASERQRVLWRQVRLLSARCQELLRIVAFVDRPDHSTVAEALGMPRGSIGPTRGRCLAKLREALLADPAWSGP